MGGCHSRRCRIEQDDFSRLSTPDRAQSQSTWTRMFRVVSSVLGDGDLACFVGPRSLEDLGCFRPVAVQEEPIPQLHYKESVGQREQIFSSLHAI